MSSSWQTGGLVTSSLVTKWYRGWSEGPEVFICKRRGESSRPRASFAAMIIDPGHAEPHVAQARVTAQSGRIAVALTRLLHVTVDLP